MKANYYKSVFRVLKVTSVLNPKYMWWSYFISSIKITVLKK